MLARTTRQSQRRLEPVEGDALHRAARADRHEAGRLDLGVVASRGGHAGPRSAGSRARISNMFSRAERARSAPYAGRPAEGLAARILVVESARRAPGGRDVHRDDRDPEAEAERVRPGRIRRPRSRGWRRRGTRRAGSSPRRRATSAGSSLPGASVSLLMKSPSAASVRKDSTSTATPPRTWRGRGTVPGLPATFATANSGWFSAMPGHAELDDAEVEPGSQIEGELGGRRRRSARTRRWTSSERSWPWQASLNAVHRSK